MTFEDLYAAKRFNAIALRALEDIRDSLEEGKYTTGDGHARCVKIATEILKQTEPPKENHERS